MKKLVVFDLDGTLNQTNLYAVDAIRSALADCGVASITDEEIISHFGARPSDYTKVYFPGEDEEIRKTFLERESFHERKLIGERGKPFDGIPELLDKLQKEGYQIAICSNSSTRYITMVLEILKLSEKVTYIQPLLPGLKKDDTLKILLDQVQPDLALMVGDRIFDKQAAQANGIPFIGCAYGYNAAEMIGSDFVAETPLSVYDGVKQLIG